MEHTLVSQADEFTPGSSLIYALVGKCQLLGIQERLLNNHSVAFYRLEIKKTVPSRSQRQETAIWVPVATAKKQGLRLPMNTTTAHIALDLLLSKDFFFKIPTPWKILHAQLEEAICIEGGIGLAKVASYLYVLKKKQMTSSPEILKLHETVQKLLLRELSDALGEPCKALEEKIHRKIHAKLTVEH